jgi:hypothetical protein
MSKSEGQTTSAPARTKKKEERKKEKKKKKKKNKKKKNKKKQSDVVARYYSRKKWREGYGKLEGSELNVYESVLGGEVVAGPVELSVTPVKRGCGEAPTPAGEDNCQLQLGGEVRPALYSCSILQYFEVF